LLVSKIHQLKITNRWR